MTEPMDAALHYSAQAFRVRLAALTFVGASLAASFEHFTNPTDANLVGTALIVIVLSLSALNQRYTHSYLCACYAAGSLPGSLTAGSDTTADRWHIFRVTNERPYKNPASRWLLSWSTYGPGVLAGGYYIFRNGLVGVNIVGYFGIAIGALAMVGWRLAAVAQPDMSADMVTGRGVVSAAEHEATKETELASAALSRR